MVGLQAEYDVASDYRINQCFLDRDGRFQPSVYLEDGGSDLFCVESLMLREGLNIDAFGTVRESGQSRFGDGDELRLGGFFQLTTFLPNEVGIVLGGRVDYNVTYAPQFSPRLALVAPLLGGFYSKAQFSSGFVYPAFLYRNGNSLSDYQGNPDIRPQTVRSVEGLLGWKTDTLRAELNGYYNDVTGFITFDLPRNARSGQYQFSNQGDLKVVGVEATTMFRLLGGRLSSRPARLATPGRWPAPAPISWSRASWVDPPNTPTAGPGGAVCLSRHRRCVSPSTAASARRSSRPSHPRCSFRASPRPTG